MDFPLSSQLLLDDDIDDAEDFDLDFDEDYEYLSEDEFEVVIEYEEYDSEDFDVPDGEFCLDDISEFGDFDPSEDTAQERGYADDE